MASSALGHSYSPQAESLSPAQGNTVSPPDLQSLLRQAIKDSDQQFKVIAGSIGVTDTYLSRMLSGEKPCSLEHLKRLPLRTFYLFFKACVEAVGGAVNEVDPMAVALSDLTVAISRVQMFSAKPQMAKASR